MFLTNLEQWQLLKSVVEMGSIAKAAEKHHKSQPAISYQLTQLQERLGIELLSLQGRRLVLTQQGLSLLDEVSVLLESWQQMEHKAATFKSGSRTTISLVVDSLFPRSLLFNGLKRFNQIHPYTRIHMKETVRDEGVLQIEKEAGDIYLVSLPNPEAIPYPKQFVMDAHLILVAHHAHPIFNVEEHLRPLYLAHYPMVQIVDTENQERHLLQKKYQESWFVTSIDSAIDAVLNQLSYGRLPKEKIETQLEQGLLLPIQHNTSERITSLYLVKNPNCQYEPCIQTLAECLLSQ
jgi:DNA-binding transcriptional LysR family regulator